MSLNVGILSIGGGVGQSVASSLKKSLLPIKLYGFDFNTVNYGSLECSVKIKTPRYSDPNYIDFLIDSCLKNRIVIIIPGLDDEALILSKNIKIFEKSGINVLVSGQDLLSLVRDKHKMCQQLNQISNIFVESFDKLTLQEKITTNSILFPLIAKPNNGSASSGVRIILNESDLNLLTEDYVIQELAIPSFENPYLNDYLDEIAKGKNLQVSEVSIQLVADYNGELLGEFMSMNRLKDGVPIEVIPFENERISKSIKTLLPMLKSLGFRGPLNIQGRLTNDGIKIFEMNARFTGITGLRSYFGFNEVEACIRSWLGYDLQPLKVNYNRFGLRQTENRIALINDFESVKLYSSLLHVRNVRESILITGATGHLAYELIQQLKSEYTLYLASRDKKALNDKFGQTSDMIYISNEEISSGIFNLGLVDTIIHTAFSRPGCQSHEFAESLDFTQKLFSIAAKSQTPKIINISSQSVYGPLINNLWSENDIPNPSSLYSLAKLNSELLLLGVNDLSPHTNLTSIRLSKIMRSEQNDLITKLLETLLEEKPLIINDGSQTFDLIDIEDVGLAIKNLIKSTKKFEPVYNLGNTKKVSLNSLIQFINDYGKNKFGKTFKVVSQNNTKQPSFGLNVELFKNTFDWNPICELEESINRILENYIFVTKERDN